MTRLKNLSSLRHTDSEVRVDNLSKAISSIKDQLTTEVMDTDLAAYLQTVIPVERKAIETRLAELVSELKMVRKFEQEFSEDMYQGVEAEDR